MPTASNVRAEKFWPAVPDHIWDSIREEFMLPTAADLEVHFQELNQPDAMQCAVRVFIGEGTFCPGFQLRDGVFNESVLRLFKQALELKIPHNVFAAWMVSPVPPPASSRPVDMLDNMPLLQNTLSAFVDQYRPVEKRR